jgi:micrococcal nuclease
VRRLTVALLHVGAVACTTGPPAPAAGVAVVSGVIDGDTIAVAIQGREETVRLLGIDTPEIHVDTGVPECFGPEASEFTASLLPAGTEVRLERDVVGRDHYGRLLAHVRRLADGLAVNEELLRRGYARPLTIAPNEAMAEQYVAASIVAEASGLGLWSACAGR